MRAIFSILLIPMVLASESLCAVHSHIGMNSGESEAHAASPHFHVDAGHGHAHSHDRIHSNGRCNGEESSEAALPAIEAIPDHNARAYYCPDSASSCGSRVAGRELTAWLALEVAQLPPTAPFDLAEMSTAARKLSLALCGIARIPLFLRDSSFRC